MPSFQIRSNSEILGLQLHTFGFFYIVFCFLFVCLFVLLALVWGVFFFGFLVLALLPRIFHNSTWNNAWPSLCIITPKKILPTWSLLLAWIVIFLFHGELVYWPVWVYHLNFFCEFPVYIFTVGSTPGGGTQPWQEFFQTFYWPRVHQGTVTARWACKKWQHSAFVLLYMCMLGCFSHVWFFVTAAP